MSSINPSKHDENQRPRTPTLPPASISNVAKGRKALDASGHYPSASSPPPASRVDQRQDLHQLGYERSEVNEMMSRTETGFDSFASPRRAQRAGSNSVAQQGQLDSKLPKRNSKKEEIVLGNDENWVLFDCREPLPSFGANGQPPALFAHYARYVPGNARIVEYNIANGNCRIRSTPSVLVGKKVNYTLDGPKLLDEDGERIDLPSAESRPVATRGGRGGRSGGRGRGGRSRGPTVSTRASTTRRTTRNSAATSPGPAGGSSSPSLSSPGSQGFRTPGGTVPETPEGSRAGSESREVKEEDEMMRLD